MDYNKIVVKPVSKIFFEFGKVEILDEATASKILEDYVAGKVGEADLAQALKFLKEAATRDPGLAALYRDVDLPGGISHETAQELMPYYLEPLARAQLPELERARFVAHLAQCPSCAAEFLELQGFDQEYLRARETARETPIKATTTAVPDQPWPPLNPFIQNLNISDQTARYIISFSLDEPAAVREDGTVYGQETASDVGAEYAVLFEGLIEKEAGAYLETSLTAWRTGAASFDLQVELADPDEGHRQAGQTVTLTYEGRPLTQQTDVTGETIFLGLEIANLPDLTIEIHLKD